MGMIGGVLVSLGLGILCCSAFTDKAFRNFISVMEGFMATAMAPINSDRGRVKRNKFMVSVGKENGETRKEEKAPHVESKKTLHPLTTK
jgi:hypothetical protein